MIAATHLRRLRTLLRLEAEGLIPARMLVFFPAAAGRLGGVA